MNINIVIYGNTIYSSIYIYTYRYSKKSMLAVGNMTFCLTSEKFAEKAIQLLRRHIYIVSVNSKKRAASPLEWLMHLTNPCLFR